MAIRSSELKQYVIRPTLHHLNDWSPAAGKLLLGTAAVESELGFHIAQNPHGDTGYGIFRISAQQHQALWDNYLAFRPELASKVRGLASQHDFIKDPHSELVCNLRYATAIAWLIYKSQNVALSQQPELSEIANIWQQLFPTLGQPSMKRFEQAYTRLIANSKLAA